MEHRKEYAGPREMLDDNLLRRILADMAEGGQCGCGKGSGLGQGGKTCGGGNSGVGQGKPCGCGNMGQNGGVGQGSKPCGCGKMNARQENVPEEVCVAGEGVPVLAGLPLVMAYVPNQGWEGILEPEEALEAGTLFAGLKFPWYPTKCRKNNCGRCQG